MTKLLIIEARFYGDIADELCDGAIKQIEKSGATCERISVPGVLELPAALAIAHDSGLYDGYV
ncbi:MAG: 6,7-dimethyl-8-ribityllumazine synthase, partial [Fimbriimonadaceae bacterium]|nr:6,7-dimethyl-8-ribityllumazine synthase [Alphaproteobacteria bacterium]